MVFAFLGVGHLRTIRYRGKDPVQREGLRMREGEGRVITVQSLSLKGHCLLEALEEKCSSISLRSLPQPPGAYSCLWALALAICWAWKVPPLIFPRSLPVLFKVLVLQGTPLRKATPSPTILSSLSPPSPIYLSPCYPPIALINEGLGICSLITFPLVGM